MFSETLHCRVKRSGALSPAPPGESEGEGGGWVKKECP